MSKNTRIGPSHPSKYRRVIVKKNKVDTILSVGKEKNIILPSNIGLSGKKRKAKGTSKKPKKKAKINIKKKKSNLIQQGGQGDVLTYFKYFFEQVEDRPLRSFEKLSQFVFEKFQNVSDFNFYTKLNFSIQKAILRPSENFELLAVADISTPIFLSEGEASKYTLNTNDFEKVGEDVYVIESKNTGSWPFTIYRKKQDNGVHLESVQLEKQARVIVVNLYGLNSILSSTPVNSNLNHIGILALNFNFFDHEKRNQIFDELRSLSLYFSFFLSTYSNYQMRVALRQKLKTISKTQIEFEEQILSLEDKVKQSTENLKERATFYQEASKEFENEIKKAKKEIRIHEDKVHLLQENFERARRKLEDQQLSYQLLQNNLHEKKLDFQNQISEIENQKIKLTQDLHKLEKQLQNNTLEQEKLKERHQAEKNKFETLLSNEKNAFNEYKENQKLENQNLREKWDLELQNKLFQNKEALDRHYEKESQRINQETDARHSKLYDIIRERELELGKLNGKVLELVKELEESKQLVFKKEKEYSNQIENDQEQIHHFKEELKKKKRELEEVEEENKKHLEETKQERQEELQSLKDKMYKAQMLVHENEKETIGLRRALKEALEDIERLKQKVLKSEKAYLELEESYTRLKFDFKKQDSVYEEKKSEIKQKYYKELESVKLNYNEKLERYKGLREKNSVQESEIQAIQNERIILRKEIFELSKKISMGEGLLEEKNKQIQMHEINLLKSHDHLNEIKNNLLNLDIEHSSLKRSYEMIERERHSQTSLIERLQKTIQSTHHENQEAKRTLNLEKQRILEIDTENKKKENLILKLNEQILTLQNKNSQQREELEYWIAQEKNIDKRYKPFLELLEAISKKSTLESKIEIIYNLVGMKFQISRMLLYLIHKERESLQLLGGYWGKQNLFTKGEWGDEKLSDSHFGQVLTSLKMQFIRPQADAKELDLSLKLKERLFEYDPTFKESIYDIELFVFVPLIEHQTLLGILTFAFKTEKKQNELVEAEFLNVIKLIAPLLATSLNQVIVHEKKKEIEKTNLGYDESNHYLNQQYKALHKTFIEHFLHELYPKDVNSQNETKENIEEEKKQELVFIEKKKKRLEWLVKSIPDYDSSFSKTTLKLNQDIISSIYQSLCTYFTSLQKETQELGLFIIDFQFPIKETQKLIELWGRGIENLFWIFSEIISNVIKHSQAKKLSVVLSKTSKYIVIDFIDNGEGIFRTTNTEHPQGRGLNAIQNFLILYSRQNAFQKAKLNIDRGEAGMGTHLQLLFEF